MAKQKRTKNQIRREKAKIRRLDGGEDQSNGAKIPEEATVSSLHETQDHREPEVKTNRIPEESQLLEQFSEVFGRFQAHSDTEPEESPRNEVYFNGSDDQDDSSVSESSDEEDAKPLSKRQKRLQNKVPLAVLKASTLMPQLVEWFDVDARDPYMQVTMKTQPNAIQVPDHWMAKRDYLSGRKGIERSPFELPKYIRDTGIQDMRQTEDQNLRQDQRNKVQPKMGRLDIDYQKLYDAFFKHQVRPRLYGFGDVYFEGKDATDEYAELVSKVKPGLVSPSLRKALELPENSKVPPPWISIMKEIGKPPAYSTLVIPGLDVEYSNTGYKEKDSTKEAKAGQYWGKMHEYVESSESEQEDEEKEENENENEDMNAEELGDDDDQPVKVPISEIGGHAKIIKLQDESTDTVPKTLYTVLKEKTLDGSSAGLLNEEVGYHKSGGKPKILEDQYKNTHSTHESTQKKFKF